jgi:hypothetical protein
VIVDEAWRHELSPQIDRPRSSCAVLVHVRLRPDSEEPLATDGDCLRVRMQCVSRPDAAVAQYQVCFLGNELARTAHNETCNREYNTST